MFKLIWAEARVIRKVVTITGTVSVTVKAVSQPDENKVITMTRS